MARIPKVDGMRTHLRRWRQGLIAASSRASGAINRNRVKIAFVLAGGICLAALVYSLIGPLERGEAVVGAIVSIASTSVALIAVWLAWQSLAQSDAQIRQSREEMHLSRRPLLLPVHQPLGSPSSSASLQYHPPAEERYELRPTEPPAFAFLQDATGDLYIPVENVGEGPAVSLTGKIASSDGKIRRLTGSTGLASGALTTLRSNPAPVGDGPSPDPDFAKFVESLLPSLRNSCYHLRIEYLDIFGSPHVTVALFDPRGVGAWHVHTHTAA